MAEQSAAKAGRAVGAMFMFAFGGAWLIAWSVEAYAVNWPVIALISAVSTGLFLLAWRRFRQNQVARAAKADTPESKKAGRIFNIVNAVQWISIFVVAMLLSKFGYRVWIIPAVIFIVGAHFIPLAIGFKVPRHYLTGAALMLFAVCYPLLAPNGPASPVGCLGAGILLWLSAGAALLDKGQANAAT